MKTNKVYTVVVVLADGSNKTVGRYRSAKTVLDILQAFGRANVQAFAHGIGGEVIAWNYLDGDKLVITSINGLDGIANFDLAYDLRQIAYGSYVEHTVIEPEFV